MKDVSLSSHTEPSIPQVQVSHPRSVDPGWETQQVTSPQTSPGDGAGAMLKPAPATKSTRLFFVFTGNSIVGLSTVLYMNYLC